MFVTVLTIVIVLVPFTSLAVGASKIQEVPNSTVLLVLLQVITGAVVSVTITVWLQRLKFPQGSVACHVRVASNVAPQCPLVLVTVLTMVMAMFVPLMSLAVGALKVQAAPNSTVLLVLLQLITGAVVSTMRTIWLHRLKLPQTSVACQVRVASKVPSQ